MNAQNNQEKMMKYIESQNLEIKGVIKQFISDIEDFIPVVAEVKKFREVTKSLIDYYTDGRFNRKLLFLLNGLQLNRKECLALCAKLAEGDFYQDRNIYRLFECINAAKTLRQIHYMINATRYLAIHLEKNDNKASLSDYFRVITILSQIIPEDIDFLKDHINEAYIDECIEVEGLAAAGVMWHSGINGGSLTKETHQQYSFNKAAELIYNYACLLDDVDNNPNGIEQRLPEHQKAKIELETVPNEAIDNLFKIRNG